MTASDFTDVFLNSFLSNFALPLADEIGWFSWLAFHPEAMGLVTAAAVLGSVCGIGVSYAIGGIIARDRANMPLKEESYQKASHLAQRYFVWLLLIAWVPFLPMFALVFGFLQVRAWQVGVLALLGRLVYYGVYLYP